MDLFQPSNLFRKVLQRSELPHLKWGIRNCMGFACWLSPAEMHINKTMAILLKIFEISGKKKSDFNTRFKREIVVFQWQFLVRLLKKGAKKGLFDMNVKSDQSYAHHVCVWAHREDQAWNQTQSPSCSSSFPFISSQYLSKLKIRVPLICRTPKGWKGSIKLLGNPHWWPTLRTQ